MSKTLRSLPPVSLVRVGRVPAALGTSISLVLASVALRLVLDDAYEATILEYFAPEAAREASGIGRIVISYALTVIVAGLLAIDVTRRPGPGSVPMLLYFGLVAAPMLTLYRFGADYADLTFVSAVAGCICVVVLTRQALPDVVFPPASRAARVTLVGMTLLVTGYVYVGLLATGGLARLNFDLDLVYEVRDDLSLSTLPLGDYLIAWQAQVINVAALVLALYRRKLLVAAVVLGAQLLLFGMTNYKSFLFAPLLVIGLLVVARTPTRLAWAVVGGAIGVLLVVKVYFALTDDIMIPSIFVRRLFFVPADIHLWFYDFFSDPGNPLVLLSNSFLSAFSAYPYDDALPYLISWAYMGLESGANVGWLADGYAQFGFAGMVVFSLVLGVLLRITDGVCRATPLAMSTAIVSVPAMALVNSALFTVLLTHGFLFSIVILWAVNGFLVAEASETE